MELESIPECLERISFNSSTFVLLTGAGHDQLHFLSWLHLGTNKSLATLGSSFS